MGATKFTAAEEVRVARSQQHPNGK